MKQKNIALKFTIITPVLNGDEFIRDTLNSINNQTYPNIEHIIVDGGSTDKTLKIIEELSKPTTRLITGPDKGLYDAMNKGINLANGSLIGILNSDDYYLNNTVIQRIVDVFNKTQPDCVYGNLQLVQRKNSNKTLNYAIAPKTLGPVRQLGQVPPHPTFFLRKEVYQKYGKFNLKYRIASDYDLMLRFLLDKKISFSCIDESFVGMRMGGVNNASIFNKLIVYKEILQIFHKQTNLGKLAFINIVGSLGTHLLFSISNDPFVERKFRQYITKQLYRLVQ